MLHTSKLDIWSFYRTESLAHGPSYDVELTESELRLDEDNDEMMMNDSLISSQADNSQRRTVLNGCYDNIELMQPASCSFILSVSFLFFVFRCLINVDYAGHWWCWIFPVICLFLLPIKTVSVHWMFTNWAFVALCVEFILLLHCVPSVEKEQESSFGGIDEKIMCSECTLDWWQSEIFLKFIWYF